MSHHDAVTLAVLNQSDRLAAEGSRRRRERPREAARRRRRVDGEGARRLDRDRRRARRAASSDSRMPLRDMPLHVSGCSSDLVGAAARCAAASPTPSPTSARLPTHRARRGLARAAGVPIVLDAVDARLPPRGVRPHGVALRPLDQGLRGRPPASPAARPHRWPSADPRRDRGRRRACRARPLVHPDAHRVDRLGRRPRHAHLRARGARRGCRCAGGRRSRTPSSGGDGRLADALDQAMLDARRCARAGRSGGSSSTSLQWVLGLVALAGLVWSPCSGLVRCCSCRAPRRPPSASCPLPLLMLVGGVLLGLGLGVAVAVVGPRRRPAPTAVVGRRLTESVADGGRRAHPHPRRRGPCPSPRDPRAPRGRCRLTAAGRRSGRSTPPSACVRRAVHRSAHGASVGAARARPKVGSRRREAARGTEPRSTR